MNPLQHAIKEISSLFSLHNLCCQKDQKDAVSFTPKNNHGQATVIKNCKDLKMTALEEINQFFGVSKCKSLLRKYTITEYTMLRSICNSLLQNDFSHPDRISLLVYIYIIETCANHSIMVNNFVYLQRTLCQSDLRKSCGSKTDNKQMFRFESIDSFNAVNSEDFKSMYNWLATQMLNQKMQNCEGKFIEYVPSFMVPSFSSVRFLSEKQRSLVRNFMTIAAKRMHQTRDFLIHTRAKNFMEYSDLVAEFQKRFKYLSEQKKAESVFNFSQTGTERHECEDIAELQDSPQPLVSLRRMSSLHERVGNRPRFKSDTLRYGLQPIPTSGKKISYSNHTVHVHHESEKELIAEHQKCSTCEGRITGLYWICTKCFHGGHINHMRKWFRDNQYCAKCFNCKCRETQ